MEQFNEVAFTFNGTIAYMSPNSPYEKINIELYNAGTEIDPDKLHNLYNKHI